MLRSRLRVGLLATALLLPVAPSAPEQSHTAHAVPGADVPALVNMEATVTAAQIDPRRPDHTLTPGAPSSVLAVEEALAAKNLLEARWVDGYFGTETVSAYRRFQAALGYRGLGANGLPGVTSLAKLGQGRFRIDRVLSPGARVVRDGFVVDARTSSMLDEAERRLGRDLVLEQGSYNPGGDPTSAGTHDGGGVVDISVAGLTSAGRTAVARALRTVGFAAWVRSPSQGDWPWHIHAVAISDTDLSTQAQHQVGDYYLGLNGLANRRPDDGPRIPVRTWEEYRRQQ